MNRRGIVALAGAAAGLGAGLVAQRVAVDRRRRADHAKDEPFGTRRGQRRRTLRTPDGAGVFIEEVGPAASSGVVFIHGSCMRTDMWHYQLPGLGGHRLVFYDLRGHGLSQPKGDGDYTMRRLADDLIFVLDDAGLDRAIIVGHSVGGMIALQACISYPELVGERIAGLALLNTTHRPGAETLLGGATVAKLEQILRRPLDALGTRALTIDRLRRIVKPSNSVFLAVAIAAFGPDASARQIDFVYDMFADTPADVIFDLIKTYRENDITDHLAQVDVPALVIGGENDRITLSDASVEIARRMPQGRLHLLDGCGHTSPLERHGEVGMLLLRFFDEILGPV